MNRVLLAIIFMCFPKPLKLFFYKRVFGYQLDSSIQIGFSLVMVSKLTMMKNSRIGHFNVIKGLTKVSLGEFSTIGSLNWITGFPEYSGAAHFQDQLLRCPALEIGNHSAITNRHLIDCTDRVCIGSFSTVAGFRSQILTHSISISEARQKSGPVTIGDYVFVGTASVVLPNSNLPSFSVLGAGSVLNKSYCEQYYLYAGIPAKPIKTLDKFDRYFTRSVGFIV